MCVYKTYRAIPFVKIIFDLKKNSGERVRKLRSILTCKTCRNDEEEKPDTEYISHRNIHIHSGRLIPFDRRIRWDIVLRVVEDYTCYTHIQPSSRLTP